MRKAIIGVLLASCFATGIAQAQDHSATVNIDGIVNGPVEGGCFIFPSTHTIELSGTIDHLPVQDGSATSVNSTFTVAVSGDMSCQEKIAARQIGLKFTGTLDDANGTVLANTDTSAGAAKGVGIGLYESDGSPRNINTYHVVVTKDSLVSLGLKMVQLNGRTPEAGTVHGALTIEIERL
ncbi:fimbrial protein [Siccibacter colletis]|uniref:fimbrial protein n=1 Tax=Siccibacter colletis TaxID=1505757 RepID=UPI003CFA972D